MPYARTVRARLEARLTALREEGLARERAVSGSHAGEGISYLSNDYLGLSSAPRWKGIVAESFAAYPPSSSASRMAGGHTDIAVAAEKAFAEYFGYEECLFFPSGCQGNLALVSALAGKGQPVLVDKRVHSSVASPLSMSGASLSPFAHGDLAHLERRLKALGDEEQPVVFVESLYSMDGTVTDADALLALRKKYGFLLVVDEAHGMGCLGPGGRGVFGHKAGEADIVLGTLGKALGFFGAFALLPKGFTGVLEQLTTAVMHSTAPAPSHAAACLGLVGLLPELDPERARLAGNAEFLRGAFAGHGIEVNGGAQILSVPVGDERRAVELARALKERGILTLAARYPTVPRGQAILRFSVTAAHTEEELARTADVLAELMGR